MASTPLSSIPSRSTLSPWEQRLWRFVGICLAACSVGLFGLVGYSLWQTLAWLQQPQGSSEQYVLNAVALTTLGILRYLAMLIGAALASGGLLVSFMTLTQAIGASAQTGGATGAMAGEFKTTSPGVVAIIIGCVIILGALFKRTELEIATNPSMSTPTTHTASPSQSGPMPSVEELRKSLGASTDNLSGVRK